MVKAFLSTFILSLCLPMNLWADDRVFLGLEEDIMPELEGPQRFAPLGPNQDPSWNVVERDVEMDKRPLKGQGFSIIPWSTLDPENYLDINHWINDRQAKDRIPDWKIRLRDDRHLEIFGKLLACKGSCTVFRGVNGVEGQYKSRILEGDEIRTDKDSVAWVYMMDGTLLRVGPETSISLQEITMGRKGFFFLVRLNHGHAYWHPRAKTDYPLEFEPETESVVLPLMYKDANQEHFERAIYQSQNDQEHLKELLDLEENAVKAQITELNRLRALNGPHLELPSRVMMVAPNATIVSSQASFDMVYVLGGNAYFKKRTSIEGEEFSLHLRGYQQTHVETISQMAWYEVIPTGKNFEELNEVPGKLQILELLTRRIKTIELAREIWVSQFSLPIYKSLDDAQNLALKHGYKLWGDEMNKRFDFLVEYTRRIETTNLKSLDNLMTKMENQGEKVERELTDVFYQDALKHYLNGLKTRYTNKKMQVREMNDLQYHVWVLKNGKF